MNEREINEKEVKEKCCKALKNYLEENRAILRKCFPEIINNMRNISTDSIILGERPRFRSYFFEGNFSGATDINFYDVGSITIKDRRYYNNEPFKGFYWMMDNEDVSDISICKDNIDIVNKYLKYNYKSDTILAFSQKNAAAKEVVCREYVGDFFKAFTDIYDLKCELNSKTTTIYIPFLPIYLQLDGKKVLVGTYYIDEDRPVIGYRKAEIKEEREHKKIKLKSRIKIVLICAAVAVAIITIIITKAIG